MAGKGFHALKLDSEQAKEISKLFKKAGIETIKPSKLHVTIMYDESDPDIKLLPNDKTYTAKITGVERLGKKGSEWEAIAFTLKSPEIEKRHKELLNAGYDHKHDSFLCHMSVVYGPNDTDQDIIELVHKLGVLPEELTFGNEFSGKCI